MNEQEKAFPSGNSGGWIEGMDLRDWFAGQALAGITGSADIKDRPQYLASASYLIADAMMVARKQGEFDAPVQS